MRKPGIMLLVVVAALLIAFPFFSGAYVVQVAITTITFSMLGLAFALGLKVGLPRLDVSAWWGVGAYTTAILMKAGMNFWLTVLIGGLIAVIVGEIIFSIIVPRGMFVFFAFCIVLAIAFNQMWGSVQFFGGWSGIVAVPAPSVGSFKFVTKPELYYLGLSFLLLNLAVYYLLYTSKIGRAWNAIGSSLRLARSVGVDVVRYRMANILIGNFFMAMAGSYFVGYYGAAFPTIFTFFAGLNIMAYVIIGGMAYSLSGPIIGSIIAKLALEYLQVGAHYQTIFSAVVVILILIFLPQGICGWLDRKVKPWFARISRGGQERKVSA